MLLLVLVVEVKEAPLLEEADDEAVEEEVVVHVVSVVPVDVTEVVNKLVDELGGGEVSGEDDVSVEDGVSVGAAEVVEKDPEDVLEEAVSAGVDGVIGDNVGDVVDGEVSINDEEEVTEKIVEEDLPAGVVEEALCVEVLDVKAGKGTEDRLSEEVDNVADDNDVDEDVSVEDQDPVDADDPVVEVKVRVAGPPVHGPMSLSVTVVTPPFFVRVFGKLVKSSKEGYFYSQIQ
jgi:hypothetical protein